MDAQGAVENVDNRFKCIRRNDAVDDNDDNNKMATAHCSQSVVLFSTNLSINY